MTRAEKCNNYDLEDIKKSFLDFNRLEMLADLFKGLGDSTRLKILHCLKGREMCVLHIAETIEMSQSAVSHQLRVLRNLRIVKYRKEGRLVFYSLDDEHIFMILDQALNHLEHE